MAAVVVLGSDLLCFMVVGIRTLSSGLMRLSMRPRILKRLLVCAVHLLCWGAWFTRAYAAVLYSD